MLNTKLKLAAFAALSVAATSANATINTVFNDFSTGVTNFNTTVTNAGGTAQQTTLGAFSSGLSVDFGDFSISRNNGGSVSDNGVYTLYGSTPSTQTSGHTISINPASPGNVHTAAATKVSGITMTFDFAINSIGFEVGDWATCCAPSNLYISFDNGAPILVGASTTPGDQFLTNHGAGVFVAALDDSGTFTSVSFWGDGIGEVLNMGGTIHYATVAENTLPPQDVPEPAMIGLFGMGALGLGLARRRKA